MHSHFGVSKKNMWLITRNSQNIKSKGWNDIFKLADTSMHGILGIMKNCGHPPPEIGFELTDSSGTVICELEFAWPNIKCGAVLTNKDRHKVNGWRIYTLEDLINNNNLIRSPSLF
jgi:hypothetical protein